MKRQTLVTTGIAILSTSIAAQLALAQNPAPTAESLLKDVKVADGFDATIFATPDQANYPVFVAAAPDGTLYVSSDQNGSLGRLPNMGRIMRLRDTKGSGRADEVKTFVPNVDSPRGLVWDRDRLYLVHPPHLSVFVDKNADGVSDEQQVLVKNLAFTFKDRPADHTTNGLELGVDGWLYIACGDFGFMEAEGTDGRKLQLRGGGVARVRPDGTGLELYAYGTRNILEVAMSPLLDGFTRDNTNDGDGWDIKFHHITGVEDHGYPKLFKFFPSEIIKPLGEYGGGSGCGATWIHEPGFPKDWNNLPYTCDWGPGPLFRHSIIPKGATFEEVGKPESLVRVPKSTDADVDALSRVYVASWKDGGFSFSKPEVGFIARVTPKDHTPQPLPHFETLPAKELCDLLANPSHRRRLAAQRELLARPANTQAEVRPLLEKLVLEKSALLESRVIAIFTLKQAFGTASHAFLAQAADDPSIEAWAIRALTDRWDQLKDIPAERIIRALQSKDARVRREAVTAAARLQDKSLANNIIPLVADADAVVAHTTVQSLIRLGNSDALLAALGKSGQNSALRDGVLRALQALHQPMVADALITRLATSPDSGLRIAVARTLSRLYYTEGEWKGDSWGTRPDTRGPYYQPEKWEASDRIGEALLTALNKAGAEEAAALASEFGRHRIKPGDALGKLVELAKKDASVLPTLARQLAQEDSVPADAIPLLVNVLKDTQQPTFIRAMAVFALVKTDDLEAFKTMSSVLADLKGGGNGSEVSKAKDAFWNAPKLENHHQYFENIVAAASGPEQSWALQVLLKLAKRNSGSPESRQMSRAALDREWSAGGKRRIAVMQAAAEAKSNLFDASIVEATQDADSAVAKAAEQAVGKLRIDVAKVKATLAKAKGPAISTLKPEDVLRNVAKLKGDAARGEALFVQQGCVACHTVAAGQPLKGPYLGNIAQTYKRAELAESILYPNKTIAQGFATNTLTLKDKSVQTGFVIQESAEKVTLRNIAGQEIVIPTSSIASRSTDPRSMMPEGLVNILSENDFASLLDYLESLAKQQK
jgi:putative heme-binding domain-containing protein